MVLLILVASPGCGFVGPPVLVSGTARDIAAVAGDWWGDYTGDAHEGRRGTLSFKLTADGREARGSVLMTADHLLRPYHFFGGDTNAHQRPDRSEETTLLSIRFVYVSDREVMGELDPYWDPDRNVRALTTFRGSLDGSVIAGTFRTRFADGAAPTVGRWQVTRRP